MAKGLRLIFDTVTNKWKYFANLPVHECMKHVALPTATRKNNVSKLFGLEEESKHDVGQKKKEPTYENSDMISRNPTPISAFVVMKLRVFVCASIQKQGHSKYLLLMQSI